MTVLDLKQNVLDLIGESNYVRFSEVEILRWLNRGQEDVAIKTGYLTWKWKLVTVATFPEYPYPDEALTLYRLEYNDLPLPITDLPTLDEALEAWRAETSSPENWYHAWNRGIGIWPTPDNAYDIYEYGLDRGATLVNPGDVPLIPTHFHRALALFAAYNIKRQDGDLATMASLRNEYYHADPIYPTGIIQEMIEEKKTLEKSGRGRIISYNRSTVEEG